MALFPIFAELEAQPCLVVGGGEVAFRKASQLLEAGAKLTVNAPRIGSRLLELAGCHNGIRLVRTPFDARLVSGATLVIAATSDSAVNAAVAEAAAGHRVLCNVVDEPEHCTFFMPATIRRGPVSIAISTAGHAPVLARWIKAQIESWLPGRIDVLARFARLWRGQVKKGLGTITARRRLWEEVFDGPIAGHVLAGRDAAAHRLMTERLAAAERNRGGPGEAWLVGAGPGDADLITLRGKQLLAKADVVLYDRLVSPQVLRFARRDAELVFVGKQAGQSRQQAAISELLVDKVRAGHRVCRLKGGDAFVFGRGGEEVEALEAAGLGYQIVPGITAALACAAYAGIPLTHRDHSHAVWLGTGHSADEDAQADWQAMAAGSQTLALYMSVGRLDAIAARLQHCGRDAQTPVAIVENGAHPQQRVLLGTLANIAAAARRHAIAAPAIVFIGEAAAEAGRHAWFAPAGFIDERAGWPEAAALRA